MKHIQISYISQSNIFKSHRFHNLTLYDFAKINKKFICLIIIKNTQNKHMNNNSFNFVCHLSFSDTENIRFVFAAVRDTILQLNLKEYNLV